MKLIAAVDQNWALGYQGDQLAYLKEDLKRFKALTQGHPVILGRKTLATFPGGRPLKGRENLILSATPGFAPEGAEVFPDLERLLARAPADSFVIGGASVYAALLPYCDTAYITKIRAAFPADVWLPNLDESPEWAVSEQSDPLEQDGLVYHYVTYERVRTADPAGSPQGGHERSLAAKPPTTRNGLQEAMAPVTRAKDPPTGSDIALFVEE